VGEVFGTLKELKKYYGPNNNGLNMIFLFKFTSTGFDVKTFRDVITQIENDFPEPYIPTYVLGNHDRMRYITRLKGDVKKAKILATMQMTLRGVPFIYYGEEIGMRNVKIKLKESEDPIGRKYSWFPISQIKSLGFALSRDGCRTPMQWNSSPNAGFSPNEEVKTWVKIPKNYTSINVEQEKNKAGSLLNFYKKLIEVRQKAPALYEGTLRFNDVPGLENKCLSYKRVTSKQECDIYLNFTETKIKIPYKNPREYTKLLFSTDPTDHQRKQINIKEGSYFELESYEAIILENKK
jgi:oligo-1,6-glucosidase/alpha-glucosidase